MVDSKENNKFDLGVKGLKRLRILLLLNSRQAWTNLVLDANAVLEINFELQKKMIIKGILFVVCF